MSFNLIHARDPVPNLERHKLIYMIPDSGFDRSYIGQTGRLLGMQLKDAEFALYFMKTDTPATDTTPVFLDLLTHKGEAIEALHSGQHSVN